MNQSEANAVRLLDRAEVRLLDGELDEADRCTQEAAAFQPTGATTLARIESMRRQVADERADVRMVPGVEPASPDDTEAAPPATPGDTRVRGASRSAPRPNPGALLERDERPDRAAPHASTAEQPPSGTPVHTGTMGSEPALLATVAPLRGTSAPTPARLPRKVRVRNLNAFRQTLAKVEAAAVARGVPNQLASGCTTAVLKEATGTFPPPDVFEVHPRALVDAIVEGHDAGQPRARIATALRRLYRDPS